jgi:sodium-dependent dicarboxylate transporter 2/3/5
MPLDAARPELNAMAAVAALMAIWWVTEAIPVAVTGLLPLVLLPLFHLTPAKDVAAAYGNRMLFLFLGGFLIALAIQESGLHRRIALTVIDWVGHGARRLVLGMILATGLLSMWMSNTATTILMLPIAGSLLAQVDATPLDPQRRKNFGRALMLGIAYSASLGGLATLVGTPTNVLFKQHYVTAFEGRAPDITFGGWMLFATPLSLGLLLICWGLLALVLFPVGAGALTDRDLVASERRKLGPMSPAERRAGLVFLITAILWIFREPVPGVGWAPLFSLGRGSDGLEPIDDTSIAVVMASLCFVIPQRGLQGAPLLSWKSAGNLPWGILLLYGGGLALADGMRHTGLDSYLAGKLALGLEGSSPIVVASIVTLLVSLLSELMSNVACVNMTLPVTVSLAQALDCDPRLLMIPTALAATCGFMLPVATAPNAIAYSTGRMETRDMVWAGLWLDLICVIAIMASVVFIAAPLLGISYEGFPEWAQQP